ncbi:TPM domain-containing protein [Rhizosphaericola mali]|uniref:TPM domain-containing protein n=1 Tax=Rhizosphaericola mali TaxID=2545455 RepID=A0A5P2G5E1_9BACT|nr:TPM domain-containing protein [Rhizosphaericola mali]
MLYFFRLLLVLTFFSVSIYSIAQKLPDRPNPPRLVNDFAHFLSGDQVALLEQKLDALDDSTSNQIAVVTINSLEGYPIEDYANKLFRAWGIGNKKTNNGVLIIVSKEDRQMRIEVGYGLEGAIPDITTSDIIAHDLTPYFKQNNYYVGLDKAVDDLSAAAVGEYHVARQRNDDSDGGGALIFFIILIIVIIIIIKTRGGGNGGGGRYYSRRGSDNFLTGMILGNLLGGGNSGGGFGGGSSGGGFGGFGGGSSGGGGASGSW